MRTTAVIMAGGKGERFWPKSRSSMPKQFLSLTENEKTMIRLTAERNLPLVSYEDMFVVTNKNYVPLVRRQLPEIPAENILAEPVGKNTAPCIGLAAAVISRKYEDSVMMVLASDHLVKLEEIYVETMSQAIKTAQKDKNLVTIGITPTYPETGYGYIKFERDVKRGANDGAYSVKSFVEKPDMDTAKEYLASGQYLWNSGMFVWKTSTILGKFKELMPDTYEGLVKIGEAFGTDKYEDVLHQCFSAFKSESIDYGIMERSGSIYTFPGNFGWDDVGGWLALERINKTNSQGNIAHGDVIAINTNNSIIVGGSRLIATVGIDDAIIIDSEDAILICSKQNAQEVKKVIESLKSGNRNELL